MSELAQWQRIEDVYHDVLDVAEGERAAFLDRVCAGDEGLRREVEALLAARVEGGDLLDLPAGLSGALPMTQQPGTSADLTGARTAGFFRECTRCGRRSDEESETCQHCGGALTMVFSAERTIAGRYRLYRLIGQGGTGRVYRALDSRLGREVAVKILSDQLTRNLEALGRFKREAQALAALAHPNLLTIYEFDAGQDISYIVTELLTGETLRARIRGSALASSQVPEIALGIAEGMAAMHGGGITHRDIRPDNIFLTAEGGVKILDFSVAHFVEKLPLDSDMAVTTGLQTELGMVIGTVPYMSPEQIRGEETDVRSDIFSFGSLLYEMISGRPPFSRRTMAETGAAILKEDPPKLPQVFPPELEKVMLRCLQKDRKDRYRSGRELAKALKSVSDPVTSARSIFGTWRAWPRWPLRRSRSKS